MKSLVFSLFALFSCAALFAAETQLPAEPGVAAEPSGLFVGVDGVPASPEELEAAEGEGIFGGILVGFFSFLGGVFVGGALDGRDEARYGAGGISALNGFIIGFFSTPY